MPFREYYSPWWIVIFILFGGMGFITTAPAQSQESTSDIPEDWIVHTLRDDTFTDYALNIVSATGDPIMEIVLDIENPGNYMTRCDAPPKWSPDGSRLAFVRQLTTEAAESSGAPLDRRELVIFHIESGERQIITDRLYRTFDWSPDGQQIVHDTDIDYSQPGEEADSSGLYVVDLKSGTEEQLLAPIDGNPLWRPQWSPDGAYIGFYYVTGLEGLGQFSLAKADGSQVVSWDELTVGSFDWSPDGSQIAFDSVLYRAQTSQLSVAGIDDTNQAQNIEVILDDMTPTLPQWSPDGESIAFLNAMTDLQSSLWVAKQDGSNPQQIAPENVTTFDWSPDGTHLVASTDQGIEVLARAGGEPQRIAEGGCPAWRPEGE